MKQRHDDQYHWKTSTSKHLITQILYLSFNTSFVVLSLRGLIQIPLKLTKAVSLELKGTNTWNMINKKKGLNKKQETKDK
jgi:hypothetical protein